MTFKTLLDDNNFFLQGIKLSEDCFIKLFINLFEESIKFQ